MRWDRLAAAVTGTRCWLVALVPVLIAVTLMALSGSDGGATRSPEALPSRSESARVAAMLSDFPGGDRAATLLVATRKDGLPLTPDDLAAVEQARDRMTRVPPVQPGPPAPVVTSADAHAALAAVPLNSELSGFELTDAVKALRAAAADGLPGRLSTHVTGGPAFGADIADAFTGANVTLLVVTALVVALLLIVTYRSPVLWLAPLIVIAFADRVATVVGGDVARAAGVTLDGSTAGITSVLVFGAGTNYALLLISRYREELHIAADHRTALRRAVAAAAPAIVASNATVVLALLTLILAVTPSTRSLGVCASCGLVVAAVFVLVILPALLVLCGRKVFWPFIPRIADASPTTTGAWHRVADTVSRRPALVASAAVAVLGVSAAGLLGTGIGLSQTEQFRLRADSVTGFDTLAAHFPGGAAGPTIVLGPTARAQQIQPAITAVPGVVSAVPAGESATGLTQWSVVLDAAPSTERALRIVAGLRDSVHGVDARALVGGADAQALDVRDGAVRDRTVLIPLILLVVLAVLFVLLRAVVAPPILVAATVLSALAALGLGGWASRHVFGFPALDNSTPLFAFLFLVALGVDYTIFLVTRTREETPEHGTRVGMVRAVSATGGVITSAGIVLAAVFCVLGVLPLIVLTQLGIIVGLGILLDTFVVRTLVIPALFALIGDRMWWPNHPGRARRLVPMPEETAAQFADRVMDSIDSASLALLISLGHQSGLFDVMAEQTSATSAQIAEAAGLNERYVREWLGGMTVARVVDYDPATTTYRLPAHRAAALTREAGLNNLARIAQYIPLLAEVEQPILNCFHHGGGLDYSQYPRFHAIMAERSGEVFDHALIDDVLPLVDGLPELLRAGVDVADFGCGSGRAINVMAQEFSASRFTGIDFSAEAVGRGAREAARRGLTNATFESHDLATLTRPDSYDLITAFDAIHDQARPDRVLANIFTALRPGGLLLMADAKASSALEDNVGVPRYTYRFTVSLMHCMPVSLGLGGAGLGTMWGRQVAVAMLGDAGFTDVTVAELESDPSNYYYLARKAQAT